MLIPLRPTLVYDRSVRLAFVARTGRASTNPFPQIYTSSNIGQPTSKRRVVVVFTSGEGILPDSCTIRPGGTGPTFNSTRVLGAVLGTTDRCHAVFVSDDPIPYGTSATIVVDGPVGGGGQCGMVRYTLENAADPFAPNIVATAVGPTQTASVSHPGIAGSAMIAAAFTSTGVLPGTGWSGVTEDATGNLLSTRETYASRSFPTAVDPLTVSINYSADRTIRLSTLRWDPLT